MQCPSSCPMMYMRIAVLLSLSSLTGSTDSTASSPVGTYYSPEQNGFYELQFNFEENYVSFDFLYHYKSSNSSYPGLVYVSSPPTPYEYNSETKVIDVKFSKGDDFYKKLEQVASQLQDLAADAFKEAGMTYSPIIKTCKYDSEKSRIVMGFLNEDFIQPFSRIDATKDLRTQYNKLVSAGGYAGDPVPIGANVASNSTGNSSTPGEEMADGAARELSTNNTNAKSSAGAVGAVSTVIFAVIMTTFMQ
jgi:hypothetical protein